MTDESGFQLDEVAPRYHESHVELFMAPFVESLVAAAVSPSDAVLDVACGTGFATRAAATATGSTGSVVGTDVNSEMLSVARSVSVEEDADIAWRQASALELPFEDGGFDAVVCQQGIQFFPDPSAGLREMARVLKNGGRLALTAWASREQSPYLNAKYDLLVGDCGGDANAFDMVFVRGEEQLRSWFQAAGVGSVSVELIEAVVALPPVAEYVPGHVKALPPPLVGNFFDLRDEMRSKLLTSVEERLCDYQTESGLKVPFRSFLAKAVV